MLSEEVVLEEGVFQHNRSVRSTRINKRFVVSTVRLSEMVKGIDQMIGTASKLIGDRHADLLIQGDYETMVFRCDPDGGVSDMMDIDMQRYDTEEEAIKGHEEMVQRWSLLARAEEGVKQ